MSDDKLAFRADENALIKFGDPGQAPILNYNVPQPAEYRGRHYLNLEFSRKTWLATKDEPRIADIAKAKQDTLLARLAKDSIAADVAAGIDEQVAGVQKDLRDIAEKGFRQGGGSFTAQEIRDIATGKKRAVEKTHMSGRKSVKLVDVVPQRAPKLAIVTTVTMSSYLGDYGAGRTINTFSLLPGESHEITIKTFKRSKSLRTESSSILDSFEQETADEFEKSLETEQSQRSKSTEAFNASASASADVGWGFGSAKASGSVSTASTSEREQFGKAVENVSSRHTASAASKRQMEINSASEEETEESEERSLKRVVKNINLGRTLNFVFRQMAQRYVTALYVTDVKLAVDTGDALAYREYDLAELQDLLDDFVVSGHHDDVRKAIHDALFYSFDYRGAHKPLIEEVEFAPDGAEKPLIHDPNAPKSYWRFRRHETTLDGPDGVAGVTVPGVVLRTFGATLPTEGVIVEALLGQGNALDAYSLGLQSEAVRERISANDLAASEVETEAQRTEIVANGDEARAALFTAVHGITDADKGADPDV